MAQKDKSAIVSGAGWLGSFADQLIEGLRARGCTDEEIHSLVTPKGRPAMGRMADDIAKLIRASKNTFRLTRIGDGRTTEELVRDGGYDYANSNITSRNFPIRPRQGTVEIVLLEFDHNVTSNEAIKEAAKRGLPRPVHEDALYFGVEHPEAQRDRPVVFLHEEPWLDADGHPRALYLWSDAGCRELRLNWFGSHWHRDYRFAFVRK